MSFFNQIYDKLFARNNSDILSKEVLNRSEKEITDYENWAKSQQSKQLLHRIKRAYHFRKTNIQDDIIIDILQTPYANGFAISELPEAEKQTYQWILEHFKEKILAEGYRQSGSDKRIKNKRTYLETTEKYYLKPPIQAKPPIDQKYGNILLELVLQDDKPMIIKVMANIYSDRLYTEALDFDDLARTLLEHE